VIDYVNVMKNTALDKLLFDLCRQQSRDALPPDAAEPADYYLISKCIDGNASAEEKKRVDAMISRDPSLAELLTPLEELDSTVNTEHYAKPVKLQTAWLPRVLRLAACLAVIVTGLVWTLIALNPTDDEMVVRSVKESPAATAAEPTTNTLNNTEADK
jgi:hypothetical protein